MNIPDNIGRFIRDPLLRLAAIGAALPAVLMASPALTGIQPESTSTASSHDIALLVVYVLLALVVSFLCSVAEAVLLSITPSYIEGLRTRYPKRARLVQRLKQDKVDQSLAAILTLNTISHTVGAIGAGAQATVVFGSAWVGLFSAIMTLLILFLSEIIPKTIGAVHWARLVGPVAHFIQSLVIGLYPLVWISERLTRLMSRRDDLHVFSRDEFLAMARMGERTGHLRGDESRIIRNLFRFNRLKISDIMTPRTVITALPEATPLKEAALIVEESPYSRLPVYEETIDSVTGFIRKDDILIANAREDRHADDTHTPSTTPKELKRDILTVPETLALPRLLDQLLEQRQHIALVVDEHGGTSGLVTLEDLVETLMGLEIMDETDNVEDLRALARKRWEMRRR